MSRWTRFAGVGVLGFAVQVVALHLLTVAGVPYPLAVLLAVEAAILHNFAWHERWTWRDRLALLATTRGERLARFNAAAGIVSMAGNVVFTALLVEMLSLPVILANVLAVAALTTINFAAADRFAFATSPPSHPRRHRRMVASAGVLLALVGSVRPAAAAEPTRATLDAWDRYVEKVEARRARERADGSRFLAGDFDATRPADFERRLRAHDMVIVDVGGGPQAAGEGTISHWRGVAFIAGVSLDEMLETAAVRGPRVNFPKEDVLAHRVLARQGNVVDLYLKLQRKAIVTAAYNTEHRITVDRLDARRGESRSIATRIAELQEQGTPRERERSEGEDRGFLWRLNSYWRYQAVEGGIIVELESVTLSRNVPWAIRAIATPLINRIARESMQRSLAALRDS